jgi:hypothetical protein
MELRFKKVWFLILIDNGVLKMCLKLCTLIYVWKKYPADFK